MVRAAASDGADLLLAGRDRDDVGIEPLHRDRDRAVREVAGAQVAVVERLVEVGDHGSLVGAGGAFVSVPFMTETIVPICHPDLLDGDRPAIGVSHCCAHLDSLAPIAHRPHHCDGG